MAKERKIAILTLREYWMGRDSEFPPSGEVQTNAGVLLGRVNALFVRLAWPSPVLVSSGYRPGRYNSAAGGAPHSGHLVGKAVDVWDQSGKLKLAIAASGGERLLQEVGLWQEAARNTPTWCHLDTIERPTRVFLAK